MQKKRNNIPQKATKVANKYFKSKKRTSYIDGYFATGIISLVVMGILWLFLN